MAREYKIVLKNGTVVDPVNQRHGRMDMAIVDGRIAEVGPGLDTTRAGEVVDLEGCHVLPGIIDLHVHASAWLGGRFGHKMMALAGVTTALDMSGPIDSVLDIAGDYGVGLNLACLEYVRPGHTVKDTDPSREELENLLQSARTRGAYGFKILGGHYPLTPEATARAIDVARADNAYLAFHAGTLSTRSDIEGFHEAIELIGNRPVHLAHINSYCRGRVRPELTETAEAIKALEENPRICSESYLSPVNGTSAKCRDGVPESQVTNMCLKAGGFPETEAGLEAAILAGWAQINMESGGQVVLAVGEPAVDWWRGYDTDTTVSFAVNPEMSRLRLATAKREDGEFAVDCISTDGGGIPRNVTVELGLALVRLGALSLDEFVLKTSRNPAGILGLSNRKGHLGEGMDADVTAVDLIRQKPVMTMVSGRVIMWRNWVCGRGGRIVTTPAGEDHVRNRGLTPMVVDPDQTPLCRRPGLK